jgi:hypothetical protein
MRRQTILVIWFAVACGTVIAVTWLAQYTFDYVAWFFRIVRLKWKWKD